MNEPCRLIPGRAREGTLSLLLGFISTLQRHAPGPLVGINCFDAPLIPGDTPMTEKRRRSLLPRGPSRHLIGLRHTVSFGSQWLEAPVNSYLTGASPIYLGLCSRTGAGSRVVRRASRNTPLNCMDDPSLPRYVSLVAPALLSAPSDARPTAPMRSRTVRWVADFVARCGVAVWRCGR